MFSYIIKVEGGMVSNDDIVEKLESIIPSCSMTDNVQKRIEDFSKFTTRLEKMGPALKDEFLSIIDDIILNGNIDVIIKEDFKVKKKEI